MNNLLLAAIFTGLFFIGLFVLKILFVKFFMDGRVYEKREDFLTAAELAFMRVLTEAVEDKLHVMCKVRLGDLLKVREGIGGKNYMSAINKIQSKHVDFVLCEKTKYTVKAVIELDDSSHETEERKIRDAFVDEAMANAGIKIFHIPVQQVYSLPELKKIIKSVK